MAFAGSGGPVTLTTFAAGPALPSEYRLLRLGPRYKAVERNKYIRPRSLFVTWRRAIFVTHPTSLSKLIVGVDRSIAVSNPKSSSGVSVSGSGAT